jgi:glutamate racemase
MGEEVKLIYPGYSIALKARSILERRNLLSSPEQEGQRKFYVSQLNKVSRKFVKLGKKFLNFKQLEFNELNLWQKQERQLF